jgi:PAS domain S-box-containing protein
MTVKKQYRDIPILFDILRSMPGGVLEMEKLALLSKEELEAKVRQRTQELEEILKELAEAKEYMDSTIKSMIDILIVVDLEGRVKAINRVAREILGYEEDELIGQPLNKIFSQAIDSLPRGKVLEKLQRGDTVQGYEMGITTKDGRLIPVELNASPIMQRGELKAIQIVARDITERKQTEVELRSSREQLRDLARHMEFARERERTRIARELHDQMGQALTALKMDLSHLNKTLSQDQIPIRDKITSMLDLIDVAIKTVKRLSTELRPGILDDLGLTAAIEWQAEEFQQRTGIECELSIYPEDIRLDEVLSTAIFRVLQESLTNVARHAEATKVKIRLGEKAGKLELMVIDNGRGVTETEISAPKSLGLVGMRERVFPWQGQVKISGICGEGTTVAVRIPLSQGGKIP